MACAESSLVASCEQLAERARRAGRVVALLPTETKNAWLTHAAAALESRHEETLQANARDLEAARDYGLSTAQIDRLSLTGERIVSCAKALREVAALPDPVGRVLE